MKTPGYLLTVKLFIPAPKNDFRAQSNASLFAADAVENKQLSAELLAVAKVVSVDGKFGSAEIEAGAVTEAQAPDPNAETPIGSEMVTKRKKGEAE